MRSRTVDSHLHTEVPDIQELHVHFRVHKALTTYIPAHPRAAVFGVVMIVVTVVMVATRNHNGFTIEVMWFASFFGNINDIYVVLLVKRLNPLAYSTPLSYSIASIRAGCDC